MRALFIAATIALPSLAVAESNTFSEMPEFMALRPVGEVQSCTLWATDFGNKKSHQVETAQGYQTFTWVRNWGDEFNWRLYHGENLDFLVIKKDLETEDCIMQVFKL